MTAQPFQSNVDRQTGRQVDRQPVQQPLTPEQVSPQQAAAHRETRVNDNPISNPGDIVDREMALEEKAQRVAVNVADITGEKLVVPTYFVMDYPDGEQKALHHVKDAEEISDVIRQARMNESGDRMWW